jgi:hypothetical protein
MILILSAASAAAQTVNCPGDSLNGALAALDKTVPNTLSINGTCTEAVVVDGFPNNLNLQGSGGAIIQRPGADPALQVRGSGQVNITGLTIQGPGVANTNIPLVSISRSNVTISNVVIQGSLSDGLDILDSGTVWIGGTTIQDNGAVGLSVGAHTNANVSAWNWPPGTSVLQRNGTGLSVAQEGTATVGDVTIQGNKTGVNASGWLALGDWGVSAPTITGNGKTVDDTAVGIGGSGDVWINPPTVIRDNLGHGVGVEFGGNLKLCCSAGTTTISNNGGIGINAWMGGQVFFWGPQTVIELNRRGGIGIHSGSRAHLGGQGTIVRKNGDPSDPNSYGGIRVEMNSVLFGVVATVSDNYGPGVFVNSASAANFSSGTVITGNHGPGVLLQLNSTAEFADDVNVTGNRKLELVCTTGSVAGAPKGARPNIGRMDCTDWGKLLPRPAWDTAY